MGETRWNPDFFLQQDYFPTNCRIKFHSILCNIDYYVWRTDQILIYPLDHPNAN